MAKEFLILPDSIVVGPSNSVTLGSGIEGQAVFGSTNTVTGSAGYNLVGGLTNFVDGTRNGVFGEGNSVTGAYNLVGGYVHTLNPVSYAFAYGNNNTILTSASMAGGHQSHTKMYAQRALASGRWGVGLYAQTSEVVFRVTTTDANPTEVTNADSSFIVLEDDAAYTFVATIVAKDTASTDHASYRLKWSTVRGSGVATVTVDGLVTEVIFESQAAWAVTVTADTTNGRPALKVTGEALKTIRWVVRLEVTETF